MLGGEIYLSSTMTKRILRKVGKIEPPVCRSCLDFLTDRELEVFHLVGSGKKSHEIANELNIAVVTVDGYRKSIKQKLGFEKIGALTSWARQWIEHQL